MLQIWALEGIPEVTAGTDLVAVIAGAAGPTLQDGDIVVVTSKIVSKAEGRILAADDREEAITAETVRIVASRTKGRAGVLGASAMASEHVLSAAAIDALIS